MGYRSNGRSRVWLLLVILVAFALRSYRLADLPVSLNLDEATNGLDALALLNRGDLTPFLPNNFGRESLFFYVQGLALHLFGVHIYSLRWVSVAIGVLSVPLLYVTGRQLFGNRWLGLLAATGLAVSYWHIYFSRLALRGVLLPPLLLGLIFCFWRGWFDSDYPRRRRFWLTLAGLLLGLTQYSYLAARLLPLLFGLFTLLELLRPQPDRERRSRLGDILLFGAMAAVAAAPLAFYFWQQPQALTTRTGEIAVWSTAQPLTALLGNGLALLRLHLPGLGWEGRWPPLNSLSAVGLLLGGALALRRWRSPAYRFVLLWAGVGLLPLLLSVQNWQGETTILRGILAWPALFLLSGLGLLWLVGRPKFKLSALTPELAVGLLLGLGTAATGYNYFGVWARLAADDLSDHPPYLASALNHSEQPTLLPLQFYAETVTHFLLKQRYPVLINNGDRQPLPPDTHLLLPAGQSTAEAFVLLLPQRRTALLLPLLAPAQRDRLAAIIEWTAPLTTLLDSEAEAIAHLYPLPGEVPFQPDQSWPKSSLARFGDAIQLVGVGTTPAVVQPGQSVTLHLDWQLIGALDRTPVLFVHLFDVAGRQRWGQVNAPLRGLLFDAYRWPAGLIVPDRHQFVLPVDAPAGAYRFEVGLYWPETQQRLPTSGAGDSIVVGKFYKGPYPPPSPQYATPGVSFGGQVALLGVDVTAETEAVEYTLHWQALTAINQNYTVFNLLVADGQKVVQQDNAPQQGRYPTGWWDAGEVVLDSYRLSLPDNLPSGPYTLRVGLYQPQTGQRLPRDEAEIDYVDVPVPIRN